MMRPALLGERPSIDTTLYRRGERHSVGGQAPQRPFSGLVRPAYAPPAPQDVPRRHITGDADHGFGDYCGPTGPQAVVTRASADRSWRPPGRHTRWPSDWPRWTMQQQTKTRGRGADLR
jgi:hypothetical protein